MLKCADSRATREMQVTFDTLENVKVINWERITVNHVFVCVCGRLWIDKQQICRWQSCAQSEESSWANEHAVCGVDNFIKQTLLRAMSNWFKWRAVGVEWK